MRKEVPEETPELDRQWFEIEDWYKARLDASGPPYKNTEIFKQLTDVYEGLSATNKTKMNKEIGNLGMSPVNAFKFEMEPLRLSLNKLGETWEAVQNVGQQLNDIEGFMRQEKIADSGIDEIAHKNMILARDMGSVPESDMLPEREQRIMKNASAKIIEIDQFIQIAPSSPAALTAAQNTVLAQAIIRLAAQITTRLKGPVSADDSSLAQEYVQMMVLEDQLPQVSKIDLAVSLDAMKQSWQSGERLLASDEALVSMRAEIHLQALLGADKLQTVRQIAPQLNTAVAKMPAEHAGESDKVQLYRQLNELAQALITWGRGTQVAAYQETLRQSMGEVYSGSRLQKVVATQIQRNAALQELVKPPSQREPHKRRLR